MCLGSGGDARGLSAFSKWLLDLKQCSGNAIGAKILMSQLQKYMDVYILRQYVVLCIMKNINQCKKTLKLTPTGYLLVYLKHLVQNNAIFCILSISTCSLLFTFQLNVFPVSTVHSGKKVVWVFFSHLFFLNINRRQMNFGPGPVRTDLIS